MTRQLRMGAAMGQRRSGPPAGYCPPPTADRLSSVEEVFLVEFDSMLAGWRLGASTFAECVPQACELFLQRSTSLLGGGGSFLGLASRKLLGGGLLLGLAPRSRLGGSFVLGLAARKLLGRGSFLGSDGVLFSLAPRLLDFLPAQEENAGHGAGDAQLVPLGAEDDAEGSAEEGAARIRACRLILPLPPADALPWGVPVASR